MEFKEITAKTVDEAITKACLEFETSSDNLEIQVVQEGTSGFLGFIGSKPAVIKVRKKVQEFFCILFHLLYLFFGTDNRFSRFRLRLCFFCHRFYFLIFCLRFGSSLFFRLSYRFGFFFYFFSEFFFGFFLFFLNRGFLFLFLFFC